jgi:hypothetical protein
MAERIDIVFENSHPHLCHVVALGCVEYLGVENSIYVEVDFLHQTGAGSREDMANATEYYIKHDGEVTDNALTNLIQYGFDKEGTIIPEDGGDEFTKYSMTPIPYTVTKTTVE